LLTAAPSAQFRSKKVAALEKRQRHFKNPRLIGIEFKFLPTVRRKAICSEPVLAQASLGWFLDYGSPPKMNTTTKFHARKQIADREESLATQAKELGLDCNTIQYGRSHCVLVRHLSEMCMKVTTDVYMQAVSPQKREAQSKLVKMVMKTASA
jgi:hypothetical protein